MTDLEALILTLAGEARGEPLEGLIGVAQVIRNRVLSKYRGDTTFLAVCLHPQQFSCWLDQKEYLDGLLKRIRIGAPLSADLQRCKEVARATLAGLLADNTHGANHYLTDQLWDSPSCPVWAKEIIPTRTLGNHVFLDVA